MQNLEKTHSRSKAELDVSCDFTTIISTQNPTLIYKYHCSCKSINILSFNANLEFFISASFVISFYIVIYDIF